MGRPTRPDPVRSEAVFEHVVFDLDGTLTDPAEGITGSFRHALASVGHPVADDVDLTWMIGPAMVENLTRHGLPDHLHAEATLAYRTRHLEVGLFQATLVPRIAAVLDALLADGARLALATAKPVDQAVRSLEHVAIADRFAVVAGGVADGVARSKTAIVADALAQLGDADPAGSAMVGDRRYDIVGGRENGCRTVAVTWGFAEAGELLACEPDHVVDTPEALLAVLRGG